MQIDVKIGGTELQQPSCKLQWNFLSILISIFVPKCVNDPAECGVKLSADFEHTALIEENYRNVLQTVEFNRTEIADVKCTKN